MSGAPEELRAFVEALAMDETGQISLAGQPGARARGPSEAHCTEALTLTVYEHAYTRPFPPPPAPDANLGGDDLTATLAVANAGGPRTELGWTLLEYGPDGSAVATRRGRARRFAPGQFLTADGALPAAPGTPLAVHLPAGSSTRQPGFYYCFGEGFRDVNDQSPTVRLYWNLGLAGAAGFVAALTGTLNRYEIPFELKVTVRAADFVRRDNAVLYLSQDSYRAAALAIAAAVPALTPALETGVPLFTKALAQGLGFAEDPGGNDSFGSARSRLVAAALLAARAGDRFPWERFAVVFAEGVANAGLDIEALWLNPGSEDIYPFPSLSPQTVAA